MDTAKAPRVTESSGQHLRREDMPPVSQVPEVQNPVEAPSSVPAEGNAESPANRDPQKQNAIRRSIGAPEIAILPGQQEQSNLPTGPSTEMRENRSQADTIKQKTAEIPAVVGNADDPDAITPAEAPTSWKLPEFAKQLPFEVPTPGDPTPGETGRSAVGAASTNGTVGSKNKTNPTATNGTEPRLPMHKAASDPALGSIDKKTNAGPGGDMAGEKTEIGVVLPDPPKDDPKKSANETESKAKGKRKVAQPIAA
ncbi:uncharacterized protein FPRN_05998 [Fusarium proliferatum]|uniref:Uncharacterized protein n=1 Tax=Gibberella intermedia TaxID=948311 RepID=A0A365MJ84_GIBIN|nr:hypothetical protein FPRO05_06798 [Fusarium proliferatum]CVK88177.1 uncharacterized protein FPRN_05998 [Fusarium proliferatum]